MPIWRIGAFEDDDDSLRERLETLLSDIIAKEVARQLRNRNSARDEILLCEYTEHCTFKVWRFDLDRYVCGCKQRKTSPCLNRNDCESDNDATLAGIDFD